MFLSELRKDTKIHLFHRTLSFDYNEQSKPNTDDLDYPSLQKNNAIKSGCGEKNSFSLCMLCCV